MPTGAARQPVPADQTMSDPIYFDSHMHTPLCHHAYGQPEEYAATAIGRGLRGIIVTCHAPLPEGMSPSVRMRRDQFDEYVALVARATDALTGQLEVKLGMETDFVPGLETYIAELHARAPFHHCLGSIHYFTPEYRSACGTDDLKSFQLGYFENLARSAETGLFDTLSHPDLIKNVSPDSWEFDEFREAIGAALDRIAAAGTAMELNTSGAHKSYPEMNPGPEMLRMMADRGIPVVISSDSHLPERVGEGFETALESVAAAGFENVSYFHERVRQEVPVARVLASLRAPAATEETPEAQNWLAQFR
ncbi:histidinol-phosphatase [soil metagenome]